MSTIVDSLIPLFGDRDTPEAYSQEALCQAIREFTVNDITGEIDLNEEIARTRDRFNDLYQDGQFSPSASGDLRMFREIARALSTVREEQRAARAELDSEFSEAASEIFSEADDTTPPAAAETDPPAASDEGEGEGEGPDASSDEGSPEPAKELVTASSTPPTTYVRPSSTPVLLPNSSALNAHRSASLPGGPSNSRVKVSVVAAAEVPQTTSGSTLSLPQLAEATIRRFGVMPLRQQGIGQRRNSIALIKRNWNHELRTYNDRRDQLVIDRIADERNLPGGSLIASARQNRQTLTAAGCCTSMSNDIWCAPSETDYTLCPPLATLEGMVDLPTIPINHGGIRYPQWVQSPDDWHGQVVVNSCDEPIDPDHFLQEGNEKVCIEGPCPEWLEQRLSIAYLCVQGDILRQRGYPELTERFISDAMVSHAHFMNHNYLAALFEGSDAVTPVNVTDDGIGSVSDSVMDTLARVVTWFRHRYKLGTNETLEGVAPLWFRDYLKLDIARKNNRPFTSVTDFEIDELFAAYSTRVQWVYDLEGVGEGTSMPNGDPIDGRPMPGGWPEAVEMAFYPAGSWVLGQQDIITLDAMYDSTKLAQNKYTALFFEEGFLLFNRCNRSFRIRLEGLCRNGGVAAPVEITCPETEPDPGNGDNGNGGNGDNGNGDNGGDGADAAGAAARTAQSAAASSSGTSRRRSSASS